MKKVILVSGKLQSGKNQFAEYLEQAYTLDNIAVQQASFAKDLKDMCKLDFRPLIAYINGIIYKIKNCIPIDDQEPEIMSLLMKLRTFDHNFYEDKNDITRILLQTYGTEIFRKRVDNDYWVERLINKIKESETDVHIITDVRFPNEIYMLQDEREFDITVIRVDRDKDIDRTGAEHQHPSEISLDDFIGFDYIIDNNGTLEDLWNGMDNIYKELKTGKPKIDEDEAEKQYVELQKLDDSIMLTNHGARSNERRVWNIDTSKLPAKSTEQHMKDVMKKFKKNNGIIEFGGPEERKYEQGTSIETLDVGKENKSNGSISYNLE